MADTKYDLFRNNICSAVTSSVYNEWEPEALDTLSSSERTIYYDGNIAFTSGDKSIVSSINDGSLLAVPDLYGTLNGLNTRINTMNKTITDNYAEKGHRHDEPIEITRSIVFDSINIDPSDEEYIVPGKYIHKTNPDISLLLLCRPNVNTIYIYSLVPKDNSIPLTEDTIVKYVFKDRVFEIPINTEHWENEDGTEFYDGPGGDYGYVTYTDDLPLSIVISYPTIQEPYATKDHTHETINNVLTVNGDVKASKVYARWSYELQRTDKVYDYGRIALDGSNENGSLEIATANENTEPIYIRQYTQKDNEPFGTRINTLTLLDANGNTDVPGNLTAKNITATNINATDFNARWGINFKRLDSLSDHARIQLHGSNGSDDGSLEIATADNNTEPIYVRQYRHTDGSIPFGVKVNELTLLDSDGNTNIPGALTVEGVTTLRNGLTVNNSGGTLLSVFNNNLSAEEGQTNTGSIYFGKSAKDNEGGFINYSLQNNTIGIGIRGVGTRCTIAPTKMTLYKDIDVTGNINATNFITQYGIKMTRPDVMTDHARMQLQGSGNDGSLEIATSDDNTEPIYVRQYTRDSSQNPFGVVVNELALLDKDGNTIVPGALTVNGKLTNNQNGASFTVEGGGTTATNYIKYFNPGIIQGKAMTLAIGSSNAAYKAATLRYVERDTTPYASFGFWGNDNILTIETDNSAKLDGDLTVNGDLTVTDSLTATPSQTIITSQAVSITGETNVTKALNVGGQLNVTGNIYGAKIEASSSLDILNSSKCDRATIRMGGTGDNDSYLEIASMDNGNEPIYIRQYNGYSYASATITNSVTILDKNGNTSFPNDVTVGGAVYASEQVQIDPIISNDSSGTTVTYTFTESITGNTIEFKFDFENGNTVIYEATPALGDTGKNLGIESDSSATYTYKVDDNGNYIMQFNFSNIVSQAYPVTSSIKTNLLDRLHEQQKTINELHKVIDELTKRISALEDKTT